MTSNELRTLRKRHLLNQPEFWENLGVTLSGGSRYGLAERFHCNIASVALTEVRISQQN